MMLNRLLLVKPLALARTLALICRSHSASAAWAQFPITETFQGTTAPGWALGGTAKLTAAPASIPSAAAGCG